MLLQYFIIKFIIVIVIVILIMHWTILSCSVIIVEMRNFVRDVTETYHY